MISRGQRAARRLCSTRSCAEANGFGQDQQPLEHSEPVPQRERFDLYGYV
jgi:hypothetical protein